jgi:transitional endoplasmic reticulum ATPase
MMSVVVGPDERVAVPWGRVVLPGIEGYLNTSYTEMADHRLQFVIAGVVKRKHLEHVAKIIKETEQQLIDHSVLRGKAFSLRLTDDDGDRVHMPEPKFWKIDRQVVKDLVFNQDVQDAIDVNIFAPIKNRELARSLGVPPRRGILLSGNFGVGKSMTATAVADVATTHGWTFIICENANEFSHMLAIARDYQPAVLFCEDIDRVLAGERNISMDGILNSVDSVASKHHELMVILTTNNVNAITRAMLRPGRLDAIIEVTAPNAKSAAQLMLTYGRGLIDEEADLTEAARLMDGVIPAVIQEVVERAKLAAIARGIKAFEPGVVTPEDLVRSARGMTNQQRLLAEKEPDLRSDRVKAADSIANAIDRATAAHRELSFPELIGAGSHDNVTEANSALAEIIGDREAEAVAASNGPTKRK